MLIRVFLSKIKMFEMIKINCERKLKFCLMINNRFHTKYEENIFS